MSPASPTGGTALSVTGLRVELTSGLPVVEDVSLALARGETLALVGESGSGKTTTALALLGYARPGMRIAAGEITIAGERMPLHNERVARRLRGRIVSHVPQEPGTSLNPSLRVRGALGDMLRAHAGTGSPDDATSRVLDRVNLPSTPEFLQRFPHQLSGGQQQRVMIAMALACQPQLVVLDEPTTGLDVVTQAHVLAEIKLLHQEHRVAMVYVSHDLAVVAQFADRFVVMYGGRMIEEGTAEEVVYRSRHPYTRGLIAAVPDHLTPRRLHGIPGVAVGLSDRPSGCAFEPRCPQRVERCSEAVPALELVAPGHRVRCIEWERVAPLPPAEGVRSGPSSAASLLVVEHLEAVHRSQHDSVVAAADVSFEVAPGECLGLVGESGSGKTTVARCIAGLHAPSAGRIVLDGEPLAARAKDRSREQRRRCQIIFQNPYESLNPRRRVGDDIAHAAVVLRGLGSREAKAETQLLLELVRLPARLADRFPRELSGGERQRVAIARAAAAEPDLIVCDEITSALDVSVQGAVIDLLAELRETLGLALLFITHDLGVVASVANRVLVFDRGRICEEGTVEQVFRAPQHPRSRELLEAAPRLAAVGAPVRQ
jgi:peptide/nickel transport system ATP-binding protein